MTYWKSDEQKSAVEEYTKRLIQQYSKSGSAIEANKNWLGAHCLRPNLTREEVNAKIILEQAAKKEEHDEQIKLYTDSLLRMSREDRLISEYVDSLRFSRK